MRRRATSISILFLAFTLLPTTASPATKGDELRAAMRNLWEDHITWTRLFIVSALTDLPDKATTTDRLLQNQVDIGNAVKPFYADAARSKLTALLKDHILIAADIVTAAKAADRRSSTRRRRGGRQMPTTSPRS
jgi:hypothetical protein